MSSAYQTLKQRFDEASNFADIQAIMGWDLEVIMPKDSGDSRGKQLAALAVHLHRLRTAPDMLTLIETAEKEALPAPDRANLREMKRTVLHNQAIPEQLASDISKQETATNVAWRDAKQKKDFSLLRPDLEKLVALVREKARIKSKALGLDPYDALLDEYEPGMYQKDIDPVFAELKIFLKTFLPQAMAHQASRPKPQPLTGDFSPAKQEEVCKAIMAQMGFNFDQGRLDVSAHPFSGGTRHDKRITTKYDPKNPVTAVMGLIHETGHALYDSGLPLAWDGQPAGNARGMAMHESQSLFWEKQVARSPEFMKYLAGVMQKAFPAAAAQLTAENIYLLATEVKPTPIRIDADEVTYPLHVILRYEIEKRLIAGTLQVKDMPQAFNEGMREMLGITPPDDAKGVLQDIHWPSGAIGYFPSYTMGAIIAAQWAQQIRKDMPEFPELLAAGNFAPIVAWLHKRVHAHGSMMTTQGILQAETGKPLDPAIFRAHLERRYCS